MVRNGNFPVDLPYCNMSGCQHVLLHIPFKCHPLSKEIFLTLLLSKIAFLLGIFIVAFSVVEIVGNFFFSRRIIPVFENWKHQ